MPLGTGCRDLLEPSIVRRCNPRLPEMQGSRDSVPLPERLPSNTAPRSILAHSLPPNFRAKRVKEGNFALFYGEIREVEVEIVGDLDEEDPIPEEVYRNFGKAAMEMANVFTVNALRLFSGRRE